MPGEYGEELEQMGFTDESETDYLDSVKFCADLVWHGEIFNTNLENLMEDSLCLRVPSEAAGGPPQARHSPGDQHHPHLQHCHTLHLDL